MITLILMRDPLSGAWEHFIGSFEAPSMEEADRRAEIMMRGAKESEMLCVTFSNKTLEDIEREMPHLQGGNTEQD